MLYSRRVCYPINQSIPISFSMMAGYQGKGRRVMVLKEVHDGAPSKLVGGGFRGVRLEYDFITASSILFIHR